jgi:hypothetical protein
MLIYCDPNINANNKEVVNNSLTEKKCPGYYPGTNN